MPENLLESELFGYEKGAFTGARKGGRPGLFEFAHQGTLFLDEVEGMSPALQVKLLRVLQEREIMRVGGNQIIHVDVRIVAATNEQLEEKVADGSFRRDLYYRLNTLPVWIPPLRERGEDLFLILEHFRKGLGGQFALSDEVRSLFRAYPWHGNVRELHNVAEYLNFTGHKLITERELPPTFLAWINGRKAQLVQEPAAGSFETEEEQGRGGFNARRMVLLILMEASQNGRPVGREGILRESAKRGLRLTQPQVRSVLHSLEKEGCVQIRRGRGGSVITEEGIRRLREEIKNRFKID